ncbi:MAG: hypothetical protein ASARMPRED_003695 [Alectoria sarmentosa]|nr:MAG: hypothetical protein ASARMPRED_003695 [Alectoria sarmentosa]
MHLKYRRLTYVVTQLSFTTVVGVADGQQAAGHDSVVMVSMMHSATMQVDGGGGQFRDLVEVIVGQYGCADVVTVMSTVVTVVLVLKLVVVYVVGVGMQVATELVRRADVPGSRAMRLEFQNVSSQDLRLGRSLRRVLNVEIGDRPYLKANKVLDNLYILKCRNSVMSLSFSRVVS